MKRQDDGKLLLGVIVETEGYSQDDRSTVPSCDVATAPPGLPAPSSGSSGPLGPVSLTQSPSVPPHMGLGFQWTLYALHDVSCRLWRRLQRLWGRLLLAEGMSPTGSWIWWSSEPPTSKGLPCLETPVPPPPAATSSRRLTSPLGGSVVAFSSATVRYP